MTAKTTYASAMTRYQALVAAAITFVTTQNALGSEFVSTKRVAKWVSEDLPKTYRETFGKNPKDTKEVKAWRVMNLMSNANFFGAFEENGIQSFRGHGFRNTKKFPLGTELPKPAKVTKAPTKKAATVKTIASLKKPARTKSVEIRAPFVVASKTAANPAARRSAKVTSSKKASAKRKSR